MKIARANRYLNSRTHHLLRWIKDAYLHGCGKARLPHHRAHKIHLAPGLQFNTVLRECKGITTDEFDRDGGSSYYLWFAVGLNGRAENHIKFDHGSVRLRLQEHNPAVFPLCGCNAA